jgi:drug/metabolite transporter (DMT)-like permease
MKSYKTYIADAGLLFAAAVWGSTFFVVKDSLQNIDPVILVGYRFLLAAIILGIYLVYKKRNIFSDSKYGIILGFFLWLLYVPQTIGLRYTSAANSGFITGLFVAFVPLFSFLFWKRIPTKNRLFAVVLSIIGLIILTGGLKKTNLGDMLTIVTAIAYALHILLADTFVKKKFDPLVLSFQQFLTVGALSLLSGLVFKLSFSIGTVNTFAVILFLALFPTLAAFVIQLVAQKFTSPVKVALIFTMEPVFAAIFAWTVGHETFHISQAFGGLLIITAMIIAELQVGNKKQSLQ